MPAVQLRYLALCNHFSFASWKRGKAHLVRSKANLLEMRCLISHLSASSVKR